MILSQPNEALKWLTNMVTSRKGRNGFALFGNLASLDRDDDWALQEQSKIGEERSVNTTVNLLHMMKH